MCTPPDDDGRPDPEPTDASGDGPCYVLYTSGSTGRPKGVQARMRARSASPAPGARVRSVLSHSRAPHPRAHARLLHTFLASSVSSNRPPPHRSPDMTENEDN